MENKNDAHPYERLTPDLILNLLEAQGYACDGRLLALNSYENRVYQIGIEDDTPVIAKFYRPGRWNKDSILEEHAFAIELSGHEIPVIAPLKNTAGETLHESEGFLFAVYTRSGGRWPDLDTKDQRMQLGRFLGRMHAVGATQRFEHRQNLDIQSMGDDSRAFILEHDFVADYLLEAYDTLTKDLLIQIRSRFEACGFVT